MILTLGHRLRRWPNIKPVLGERLVFADIVMTNKGERMRESVMFLITLSRSADTN